MNKRDHDPTAELVARAQGGSLAAFGELVTTFEESLVNFLARYVRPSDAEDLAQDTFVRAWKHLPKYDSRYRFSTWLFTIAERLAISHGRKRKEVLGEHDGQIGAATDMSDPAETVASRDEGAWVWQVAERALTRDQHIAMWLRYGEDLTIDEISQVTRHKPSSVRVLLHRARGRLAQALENHSRLEGHSRLERQKLLAVQPQIRIQEAAP